MAVQQAAASFAGAGALSVRAAMLSLASIRLPGAASLSVSVKQGLAARVTFQGTGRLAMFPRLINVSFAGAGSFSVRTIHIHGSATSALFSDQRRRFVYTAELTPRFLTDRS